MMGVNMSHRTNGSRRLRKDDLTTIKMTVQPSTKTQVPAVVLASETPQSAWQIPVGASLAVFFGMAFIVVGVVILYKRYRPGVRNHRGDETSVSRKMDDCTNAVYENYKCERERSTITIPGKDSDYMELQFGDRAIYDQLKRNK